MIFDMLPPEVNSGLIYAGPGSGSLLAAASAWNSLASDLTSAAGSYHSVVANLTTGPWLGPTSTRMASATAPYVAWLHATAANAEQAGAHAAAAAGAYETARGSSVPPALVAANRIQLAILVATNFLGQNTPAIAANEAEYAAMWAQDALAMDTYAMTALHHTAALPAQSAAPQASTGSPAQLATSVQSMTTNAAQLAQQASSSSNPPPTWSDFGTALQAALQNPSASTWGTVGTDLTTLLGSTATGGAGNPESVLLPIQVGYYGAMMASMPARMLMGLGNSMASGTALSSANSSQSLLNSVATLVDSKMQGVMGGITGQLRSWGSAVSAQLASAHRLGGLSVPNAWQAAAPSAAMTRAAPVLPGTSMSSPTMSSGLPSSPFTQALMGAMSGRGLGHLGGAKIPPKVVPRSPAGG